MGDGIKRDRAGVIPYIIYILYTTYMTVVSVTFGWPSWITAVIICGLFAEFGLNIIMGYRRSLPRVFLALMLWMNLIIYSIYNDSFTTVLGTFAAAVVLLSLFDMMIINYISLISIIIVFVSNILIGRLDFGNTIETFEFIMQFLAIMILVLLERSLLKNRIKHDEALAYTMKELEDAQRGKDDFMANVSHEIRTPLNAIIGIGDELLESEVDDDIREKLYDITVSGRNLMSLVSDILDFSELQNDTMELTEEPYNITSIINDAVNMANAWNREKKLDIIVDCEADIPNNLLGDSQKIYRIIINLLNNAIKFTDNGGVIIFVGTRKEEYGVNLMIKIQDTGIGMSEQSVAALDNTYNQVDTTRDRRASGVGLGLAISRKMINKMNGHMHISSVSDMGTTVSIIIPQKALTDMPLVSVKDAEKRKIIFYMDLERYRFAQIRDGYLDCIQRMNDKLHINTVRCSTMHELKRRIGCNEFEYLFIADIEYLKDKEYFDSLNDMLKVVVMANRNFDMELLGEDIQIVYRPMHVFSIATILNGEELEQTAYDYRWNKNRFMIKGARVLAVDDSSMNLKVVSSLLSHYGITIDIALSGKQAIDKIRNKQYDLVFMDHMMPEMDGVECMHRIREMPEVHGSSLAIVALTANAISGAREMLIHEGFDDFVAKPIEKSTLERVLRKFLGSYIIDLDAGMDIISDVDDKADGEENSEAAENNSAAFEELDVDGIDYNLGLSYFDNNKKDYNDIVKCFYEQGAEQVQSLENFFEQKDWGSYKIVVHSVKGQALTIGAKHLSDKAKGLQIASQKNDIDYINTHHKQMIEEYRNILEGLSKYMEDKDDGNLINELRSALDNLNQEQAYTLIEQIRNGENGPLSAEDIKVFDRISEQIDVFDFISATEILEEWGGGQSE